jgi:hypothetical protein
MGLCGWQYKNAQPDRWREKMGRDEGWEEWAPVVLSGIIEQT